MSLATGTRLGPYEILSAVGAGGMGEVYRAKDTRLDRVVAIKVLPSHLSENPQLKQRFEREARAISSLSHPHICALYDIGQQEGIDYLVMEYLEGESLSQRLNKGALPIEQVLRYGVQIAEALDKAHRQGIIHRDLKPGNIVLTKSGAKLLDFGLAKLQQKPGTPMASELETRDRPLTEEGTVLGTVQYMAPEQLEGREADSRTDIFALGEVLYEMATARPAFQGKSKAGLMSAILSAEPPLISTVMPMVPPTLDRIVKKCLAKDPEERWQSARDVAGELKWISESTSQTKTSAETVRKQRMRLNIGSLLSVLFFVTTIASLFFVYRFYQKSIQSDVLKVSILPEENTSIGQAGSLAISPNGKLVAFVAISKEGTTALYVRPLDTMEARRLPGTEDAAYPFWSPDSAFLGFFGRGKLWKIDIIGGPPQTLCESSSSRGASWSSDGTVVFSPSLGNGGLYKVSAAGGAPAQVTDLDAKLQEATHRWPMFMPDGKHFLYVIHSVKPENSGIFIGSLDSSVKKRLLPDEYHVEYAPQGYLVFVRETTLMAQRFDLSKLACLGDPFPLAEKIYAESGAGVASFSVSAGGVLTYATTSGYGAQQFAWVDRQGKQLSTFGEVGISGDAWFSPDEKKVVFYAIRSSVASKPDIWMAEFAQGTFTRFTFDPANDFQPIWSPDGSRIVFASNRKGSYDLYEKMLSGSREERPLLETKDWKFPLDWTADGRYLIFENDDHKTKADLWILPLFGDRKPFPYLQTEFNETHAKVSPDGKWVAYGSDETGRSEIYVQSFPVPGAKRQVSAAGGDQPQWSKVQNELFYLAQEGQLMSVQVEMEPGFEAGIPVALFPTYAPSIPLVGNDRNQYLVASDGNRFLINRVAVAGLPTPITVVINWTKLLNK